MIMTVAFRASERHHRHSGMCVFQLPPPRHLPSKVPMEPSPNPKWRAHSRRLRNRVGAPATESASGVRAGTDDRRDGNGVAAPASTFDGAVADGVPDMG